ncbi:uncharacterized protein TRIVIDRAFT_232441 [Trichoderma virens Gv29-8]|uniref:Myocyte-specific enhancer factor 2d n=1 Tax=Hypocrea virens (strain Gv29-8 / FGSC 10586) TaxID=413071 RepID=G9NAY4_HYPVG|nr:uncharacterized protein TRIVIDRAFT_232441 [Trichoderma virens Gv29-8]EHK15994.1 hypothetical protein TRIVIDRAFT_232441 [Trichoderma virens Gv29-8]UKZ56234.1 hypothetical protein TrVGV298_010067 [Trichoderma virens]
MSSTPAELPGYYYDAEKKRYFAIEKSHTAPASAKWSSASVKRRKLESQAAEEASKEEELIKNSVKRNVLIHDAAASGLLAREMGSPRTAEAGRGRLENGDMAAAMWARGLTDKGSVAFEISLNYETHPHMPCFYVSGKECGTESAIAYSSFDDELLMGIYIETDENENLKTRSASIRQSGKPHYEMIYCPQMSSIKYHQPTNKVLLTSKQYGENRSLCVFTPPMETSPDLGLHWALGEINSYRNIMNDFSQNWNWGVNQSTPAPASSNLLCVVGTNKGIQRIHLNETPSWITQTATPPNYGHDARIDYPGRRTYFGPQEIFSQDFQVGNHNILLAGGRQHRLWITDLRAPAAGWSFVKYGSSIAHVRSINSHQVLVAGLQNRMSMYDMRYFRSDKKGPRGLITSSPLLEFPDYKNESYFQIGWDVSTELNLVASAQDNGTVKLFSLSSGRAVRSGKALESLRTGNPVKAMMFQTLPGEKLPSLYVAEGLFLKKFGFAPGNDSDDE